MKVMRSQRIKFNRIVIRSTSAFLAFWLSSVLVLVCCSSHLFMASASNSAVEEENSCPMGTGHDCCKKKKDAGNVAEAEEDKADCCVFKPNKTLSADLQSNQNFKQSPAVTEKQETPIPVHFIRSSYQPAKIYHSAIRNRGSTYLQNCVFRI